MENNGDAYLFEKINSKENTAKVNGNNLELTDDIVSKIFNLTHGYNIQSMHHEIWSFHQILRYEIENNKIEESITPIHELRELWFRKGWQAKDYYQKTKDQNILDDALPCSYCLYSEFQLFKFCFNCGKKIISHLKAYEKPVELTPVEGTKR